MIKPAYKALALLCALALILSAAAPALQTAEAATASGLSVSTDTTASGLKLSASVSALSASTDETTAVSSSSVSADEEFRAVWIAYYDFSPSKYSNAAEFTAYVDEMFDNVAAMNMNAVVVHVRPFSDAMYKSSYYPWSKYASGTQGTDPGYDPLEIMITEAHARGLEFHAWLNPYRVTSSGTDPTALSKDNPARKYLTNSKTSDDRNVLAYHNALYYNPSKEAVRKLIVKGVKEIVKNYDVDGIHFDDYFYPAFSEDTYETYFDAPEYEEYAAACEAAGTDCMSIVDWRKNNVNTLIKSVYSAIKKIDPDCVFGISPGGYIDYFDDDFRWYVDYRTWMSKKGYVDYICPQLYWSFNTLNIYPYAEVLGKWESVKRRSSVKLYVGLPAYKMNKDVNISTKRTYPDAEWYNQFELANMVTYARSTGQVRGYIFFDYADMVAARNKTAVSYLMDVLD